MNLVENATSDSCKKLMHCYCGVVGIAGKLVGQREEPEHGEKSCVLLLVEFDTETDVECKDVVALVER